MKSTFNTALLLAIFSTASLASAQDAGREAEAAAPSPPSPEATVSVPDPVKAPPHAPEPASGTLVPPPTPESTSSDTESEITISAPRPEDMQKMSDTSLKDVQLGSTHGRYSLNFFADTAFTVSSANHAKAHPSFGIGDLDTLLTAELENSVRLFAEFALEVGDDNHVGIDLERLQPHAPRERTRLNNPHRKAARGANCSIALTVVRMPALRNKRGCVLAHDADCASRRCAPTLGNLLVQRSRGLTTARPQLSATPLLRAALRGPHAARNPAQSKRFATLHHEGRENVPVSPGVALLCSVFGGR